MLPNLKGNLWSAREPKNMYVHKKFTIMDLVDLIFGSMVFTQ
uniref:Uncharacterized protein n=1 Tax=Arundo donax TaxID=35708 RepID=A0A0A9DWL1_ARUDO